MDNSQFVITEKTRKKVRWTNEGVTRYFFGIKKFNCRVVSLLTKWGGTYFTVIPISKLEYRAKNKSSAHVKISKDDDYITFMIYDDWGQEHIMEIPRSMKREIKYATQSAVDDKLL